MRVGKRGLSPVIASVLLILLVLTLSSLVFAWARGFIAEKESEGNVLSADELCRSMDFEAVIVGVAGDSYDFEAVNRGNIDISSLKFKVYSDGDSNIVDSDVGILAGGSIVGNVVLSGVVNEVDVLGVLDGKLVGGSENVVCVKDPVYLGGI